MENLSNINRSEPVNPLIQVIEDPTTKKVVTACKGGIFDLNEEITNRKKLISFDANIIKADTSTPLLTKIKSIELTNLDFNDLSGLGRVSELGADQVTYLDFSFFANKDPNDVLRFTPNLTTIDLSTCDQNKLENFIDALGRHNKHLTTINLSTKTMTPELIAQLKRCCPNLTEINLSYCKGVNDDLVADIVQKFPSLSSFNLKETQVKDQGVLSLQNLKNLKEINLAGLQIAEESVLKLAHQDLTSIGLSGCTNMTAMGLIELTKKCPKLQSLHIKILDITDDVLKAIGQNCPDLKSIKLFASQKVSDAGIAHLANCTKLSELILMNLNNISDKSISTIAQNCEHLTTVNLLGCRVITGLCAEELFKRNILKLDLSFTGVNDTFLENVETTCPTLEMLSTRRTECGFNAASRISKLCPNLKKLHLISTPLNDADIQILTNSLSKLSLITLAYCPNLTDASLEYLAQAKNLTVVYLEGSNITTGALDHFKQQNQRITLCESYKEFEPFLS